jgi:predicted alpha/beta-hydrolase family hydrolase
MNHRTAALGLGLILCVSNCLADPETAEPVLPASADPLAAAGETLPPASPEVPAAAVAPGRTEVSRAEGVSSGLDSQAGEADRASRTVAAPTPPSSNQPSSGETRLLDPTVLETRQTALEIRLDLLAEQVARLDGQLVLHAAQSRGPLPQPIPRNLLAAALALLALLGAAAAFLALRERSDNRQLRARVTRLEALVTRIKAQQKHLRGELDGGPESSGAARELVQLVRDAWEQTHQALAAGGAAASEQERLKGAFDKLLDLDPQAAQIGAQQIQSRARRVPGEVLQRFAVYAWPDNAVKGLLRAAYEEHARADAQAAATPPLPESGRRIEVDGQPVSLLYTPARSQAPEGGEAEESEAPDTLVLAHGIGENRHSPLLSALGQALGRRGTAVLRFNFPFAEAGKRGPDRDALMDQVYRGVVASLEADPEWHPGRLFLGGRRLGARCASRIALDTQGVSGLVALAMDLHPQGKPTLLGRGEHLSRLPVPALFVCAELDRQCSPSALAGLIGSDGSIRVVKGVNQAFKPGRIGAVTERQVIEDVADMIQAWIKPSGD